MGGLGLSLVLRSMVVEFGYKTRFMRMLRNYHNIKGRWLSFDPKVPHSVEDAVGVRVVGKSEDWLYRVLPHTFMTIQTTLLDMMMTQTWLSKYWSLIFEIPQMPDMQVGQSDAQARENERS
eukprot:1144151-Amphidinium_carterae.1